MSNLVKISSQDAVLDKSYFCPEVPKEFGFNPLGNRKQMKDFKNVTDTDTFFF